MSDSDIVKVTSIAVTAAGGEAKVAKGGKLQLSAAITPDNASSKAVSWTSSDETKATVDSNGVVTGLAKADKVTITATAKDGSGVTGTIDLEVFMPAPVAGVVYTFNLVGGVGFPYTSEDTFLDVSGSGNDNGGHGLNLGDGSLVKLSVAGSCTVVLQTCRYDNASSVAVTDGAGKAVATVTIPAGAGSGEDPTKQSFVYEGEATTLNLAWSGNSYLHGVIVKPLTKADSFFVDTVDNGTFTNGDLSVTIANTNPNGHGVEIKNDHSSTVTAKLPAGEYILGIGTCKYGDATTFEVECANGDFKKEVIGSHVYETEDCYKAPNRTVPYGQYWIVSSASDMVISINTPNGTNKYMPFIRATSTAKPKGFVSTVDNGTFTNGDLSVTIANTNPNGHGVEIKNDHSSTVTAKLPAGEYILGIGTCKYGDATTFEVECANGDFKKEVIGSHVYETEDCYKAPNRTTPYGQYWIVSSASDMVISINTPNGTNKYMPFILVD